MIIEKVIQVPSEINGFVAIRNDFFFQNNSAQELELTSAISPLHSINQEITCTAVQANLFDQIPPEHQRPCPCCKFDQRSLELSQNLEEIRKQIIQDQDTYKYQTILRINSGYVMPYLRVHKISESN